MPLPSPSNTLVPENAAAAAGPNDHRRRLLDAMAALVARQGYAATTIADIAAEARMSKRTFYEQFAGKAECLMALYRAASDGALQAMRVAIAPEQPWDVQVEQAVAAYLGALACSPALVRTLIVEILHLGPEGLKVRRQVHEDIARFIVDAARERQGQGQGQGNGVDDADGVDGHRPWLDLMATAIVGGIDEWLLQAVETDRVAQLAELARPAAHFVRAVMDSVQPDRLPTPLASAH